MGPPTQAMGPPWSDAGVGVGMLRGAGDTRRAICAVLTPERGTMCFSDTRKRPMCFSGTRKEPCVLF